MIRMRVSAARAVLVTSVAVATLGGLVAAPALASGGPAAGKPVAARSQNPVPYGMSALTYRRMRAQIPLDNAAARIRGAAAASRAGRRGFVQVRVDADRGTLTVYWHGQVPAGIERLFAALRSHLHLAVRPAHYTLAQLNHAVHQVMRGHPALTFAAPLVDGSGISVGTTGRVRAMSPLAAERMLHTGVPVALHSELPARLFTCQANSGDTLSAPARCNDLAPGFWGGAVTSIFASGFINGYCTTGFGVHFSNGSTGMLTAGHCINNSEISPGPSWWNGQATTELGSTAHTPYRDSATASHDSGVIVTPSTSANRYYDGPSIFSGDTHGTKHVVGAQPTNPGDWTCESGSFGGVLCNVHVSATGATKTFTGGIQISGLAVASGGNPNQPTEGDSGGPVFSLAAAAGTVTAKGTITGGDGVSSVLFTPWQVISTDLGVSINT